MSGARPTMAPDELAAWTERARRGDLGFASIVDEHGTYNMRRRGCECAPCVEAARAYMRERRRISRVRRLA